MNADETILFVPHFNNSFLEMLPVALRLRDQYGYKIHFVIDWVPYAKTVKECLDNGFGYTIAGGAVSAVPDRTFREQEDRRPVWILNIRRGCRKLPVFSEIAKLAWQFIFQTRMERQSRRIFKSVDPSIILVYRDDTPRVSTYLTCIANKNGIPTVLYPSQIVLAETAMAILRHKTGETISNLSRCQKAMYRVARTLMPRLTHPWDGEEVIFLPPETALVAYGKGIFPRNPWIRGGGNARMVSVAMRYDCERLIGAGIDPGNILLTGYPPMDPFFNQDQGKIRENLCRDLEIPADRFIICYASYPLLSGQEDMLDVSFDEFRSHERFLVETFLGMSPDVHVVFKLHPRSALEEYGFLPIGDPRLTVIRDTDINAAIAGCDLFSTYVSTTIFFAFALNKPILTFGFRDDPTYELLAGSLRGTYQARSRQELVEVARRAMDECRSGCVANTKDRNRRPCYGAFEGNSTVRLAEMIHKMVNGSVEGSVLASNRTVYA